MKRMVAVFASVVSVLALSLALCGCSSSTYSPEKKEATVTSPAIAQEGVLRVGVNSSNAPFSAQVSGGIVGLDVDVAAALADEMGLTLEIVDVGTDSEGALKEGTVDIIMSVDSTDTAATCWTSDPYIDSAVALFATDENATMPKKGDKNLTIEAQTSSMSAWEVSNQFGDEAMKGVSDLKTAFSDLSSGKTAYSAADAVIGSYVAHSNSIEAHIVGIMETPSGYCVGVGSDNENLQKAVAAALKSLSDKGIVSVIEKKWLGMALDMSKLAVSEGANDASAYEESDSESDSEKDSSEEVMSEENAGVGEVGSNAAIIEDDGSGNSF